MKLIQMANSVATLTNSNTPINLGSVDRREVCGDLNAFTTTTNTISINRSGYYLVSVDVNLTAGAVGVAEITLYDGTTPISTAIATTTAANGDVYNLSFSKVIRVSPNTCSVLTNIPKILSIYNTGVNATIDTINISVVKVG